MCGFAGFLYWGPPDHDVDRRRALLEAMGRAIAHRGPDEVRYADDGRLALVFQRLAIVDQGGGSQPFVHPASGLTVAVNGEIYNHEALRRDLGRRHDFRGSSDCETVLHAWQEHGSGALERLEGMFALVAWDPRRGRLTLARDRLGIKPLYVCRLPEGLLFGSELKALLAHPRCPRDLDWHALDVPLISQSAMTSYVRGVELLPGGHLLQVDGEACGEPRAWWRLEDHLGAAPFGDDARRYQDRYVDLLLDAARTHLQGEAGTGLLLSGGLDSSLLAVAASRHTKDLPCFSVVERGAVIAGDVPAARCVTAALGLPWRPVRFDHRSIADDLGFDIDRFEQQVWMMDSPRFDVEWLFKGELHRVARQHHPGLKVMLLGQGADEFAGGYSHRADAAHADWAAYLRADVRPLLAQHEAVQGGGVELLGLRGEGRSAAAPGNAPYHRLMARFVPQLQHHNLWHEDRSSSWHSLEARVPFLDHRLVELLASVPASLQPALFWRKGIVREAMRRLAPQLPITQAKLGFLDASDGSSMAAIERQLALRVWPGFRERHGALAAEHFDLDALADCARTVRDAGPQARAQARLLLQAMAVVVFRALCRGSGAQPELAVAPLLPVIEPEALEQVADGLAARPQQRWAWQPGDAVRRSPGAEALVSAHASGSGYAVLVDGQLSGRLSMTPEPPWLAPFFRHLGSPGAEGFTVQDWLDEFDLSLSALSPVLDVLTQGGLLEPPAEPGAGPSLQPRSSVETLDVA